MSSYPDSSIRRLKVEIGDIHNVPPKIAEGHSQ